MIQFRSLQKLALLAVMIVTLSMGLLSLYALVTSPYLGIDFQSRDGRWYVSGVDPSGPAAQLKEIAGSEVISIGDWELKAFDLVKSASYIKTGEQLHRYFQVQDYFARTIRIEKPATLIVKSEDGIRDVTVMPSSIPLIKLVAEAGSVFFMASFALFLGTLVFFKRPDDQRARVFFLLLCFIGLYFYAHAGYEFRDLAMNQTVYQWLLRIDNYMASLVMAVLLHFSLIFPREQKAGKNPLFLAALYLSAVFFTFIGRDRWIMNSVEIFDFICAVGIISIFIYNYFSTRSAIEKAQIRWVVYGISGATALFLFLYLIPFFMGHIADLTLLSLMPLPGIVAMAFAIMRHHLLDIDTLFDNTLIYSATIGVLALIDVLIIGFLTNLNVLDFTVNQPVSVMIAILVIIFAYLPIRDRITNLIKRLMKRELYDINDVAAQLNKRLISAATVPEALSHALETIEGALHPKGGTAILWQGGLVAALSKAPETPLDEGEIKHLSASTSFSSIEFPDKKLPRELEAGALVPLLGATGSLGYLLLQEKHSGRLYNKEDLNLLDTVGGHAALAVEAILQRERRQQAEKEVQNLQEQLLQIQKLDAIGKFAGGIAHDFKNLLVVMQGYTELALEDVPKDGQLRTYLQEIQQTANRGVGLTRKLLLFSQNQSMDVNHLNCNATVTDMLKMLRFLVGKQYSLSARLADDLWAIEGDNHQLSQVLMNLVINARDAMPSGGEIIIETRNAVVGESRCKTHVEAYPGNFICLSVKDRGIGMDETTLSKIFEPFFTTKETGKGTGLGLSIVFGIIKRHKGWIDVKSIIGEGATFEIYLPASQNDQFHLNPMASDFA